MVMDSSTHGRIYFNTAAFPVRDRFPALREEFARQLLTIDAINRSTAPFSTRFEIDCLLSDAAVQHVSLALIR
jgi:hypothetical protein